MNNIKNALTRKFGPLPAWAWGLIVLVGLWYYRNKLTPQASGTGTGSIGPAPATPQPLTTLQPGESVYNPNTGTLTTAPGGGGSDTTGTNTAAADLGAAMDALTNAIANGMPPQQIDIIGPSFTDPAGTPAGTPSAQVAVKSGVKRAGSALTKPGAFSALTGGKRGKSKQKGQANAKAKTSKHTPQGAKAQTRSSASARTHTGGRTAGRTSKGGNSVGARGGTHSPAPGTSKAPTRASQRSRTPAVTKTVQQRRPATTPRQSPTRQTGHVAPRPSAPPPRTVRAPAPPPPRPAPPRPRPAPPPPRHRGR